MTSDPSAFAILVQSIASSNDFSSSSLLIPRKDATSVSTLCYYCLSHLCIVVLLLSFHACLGQNLVIWKWEIIVEFFSFTNLWQMQIINLWTNEVLCRFAVSKCCKSSSPISKFAILIYGINVGRCFFNEVSVEKDSSLILRTYPLHNEHGSFIETHTVLTFNM